MVNLHEPITTSISTQSWDKLAQAPHTSVRATAPGKLIISGEHAVLYDQPALALAINRYTTCIASSNQNANFGFNLLDLPYAKTHSLETLQDCAQNLQQKYTQYLGGNLNIRELMRSPANLLEYAVAQVIAHYKLPLMHGINIEVNSAIPIGCGLGSSAAAVLGTVYAVTKILQLDCSSADLMQICQQIENLQHGKSSGLDLHLITNGGCALFQNGKVTKRPIPKLPMYIVNTGQPQSTTGQCVSSVTQHFVDSGLGLQFGNVTRAIDHALLDNNLAQLQSGIKQNHRLLQQIDVVPATVANFIYDVEQHGAAAKICGAGSIDGDSAGVVLIVGTQELTDLATQYGYSLQTIEVDIDGTRII